MSSAFIQLMIDEMLDQVGLVPTEADMQELRKTLSGQLEEHIGIEAVKLLDHKGKVAYLAFLEKYGEGDPQPEELLGFFREHISDFDRKIQDSMNEYIQKFIRSVRRK